MDMLAFLADHYIYFCPADDLSIFFVFGLLEHLGTADRLHWFPIDGADDAGEHKQWYAVTCTHSLKQTEKDVSCLHWTLTRFFAALCSKQLMARR